MKKILSISLIFLLILSTTGIFISKHYCNNRLVSASLFSKSKSCCGTKCNTCKNVTFAFKLSQKFIDTKTLNSNVHITIAPHIVYLISLIFSFQTSFIAETVRAKSPPIKDCLLILNSTLRLWLLNAIHGKSLQFYLSNLLFRQSIYCFE